MRGSSQSQIEDHHPWATETVSRKHTPARILVCEFRTNLSLHAYPQILEPRRPRHCWTRAASLRAERNHLVTKSKGSAVASWKIHTPGVCASQAFDKKTLPHPPTPGHKNLWKPVHKPARIPALPFQYPHTHKKRRFCPSLSSIDCKEKQHTPLFSNASAFSTGTHPALEDSNHQIYP